MGRPRATKQDNRLPPYVYRKERLNLVEHRPYLGKGKFGQSVYLKDENGDFLPFNASMTAIFKAYSKLLEIDKPPQTLGWLFAEYWKSPRYERLAASTKKHYAHYRAAIEGKELAGGSTFGDVPLDKITRGVIARYRDSMAHARIQANRHLQFLGGVFSYAMEMEHMQDNPVSGVEKNRQAPRSHYVEDKDYWLAYGMAPTWLQAAMELAYLCRGRKGEVLSLRSREHILDDGIYLQRTKGSSSEVTQWSERLRAAVALAKSHHRDVVSPFLLHGAQGKQITGPAFNSAWKRLMGKVRAEGGQPFPFHDLKGKGYSDATHHSAGHKSAKMHAVYMRLPEKVNPTR